MRPAHNSGRGPVGNHRTRPITCPSADDALVIDACDACGSGVEDENMDLMTTLTIDSAEALAPFGNSDVIPLPEIGNHLGISRATRNDLVKKKLIHPAAGPGVPDRGHGRKIMVDRDEALLIIASALVAAALGVALATVIRGLRNTGVVVTADAVSIPLSGLGSLGKVA